MCGNYTCKINMKPKNGGLVQMTFLLQWVIFRFKMLRKTPLAHLHQDTSESEEVGLDLEFLVDSPTCTSHQ